ncbi:MAG: hypothetical protein ACERKD_24020 [Prolixibacteraceae bacterium]
MPTFSLVNLKPGLYLVKTTTYNGFEKVEKILKKEQKYGVVEYELTNGEIFDLDEACITIMEERQ